MTPTPSEDQRRRFERLVGRKAERHIEARRRSDSVWFWLGMLGLIGWSVAIPTVIGVAIGLWLDRVAAAPFSWTLSLLVVGLAVGLLTAWFWVRRESAEDTVSRAARTAGDEEDEGGRP